MGGLIFSTIKGSRVLDRQVLTMQNTVEQDMDCASLMEINHILAQFSLTSVSLVQNSQWLCFMLMKSPRGLQGQPQPPECLGMILMLTMSNIPSMGFMEEGKGCCLEVRLLHMCNHILQLHLFKKHLFLLISPCVPVTGLYLELNTLECTYFLVEWVDRIVTETSYLVPYLWGKQGRNTSNTCISNKSHFSTSSNFELKIML